MQDIQPDSAEPAADRGEVFREINEMTVSLDSLEASIKRLGDRLNPIISKVTGVETEVEAGKPKPGVCPLSEQMRGHRTRLNHLESALSSIRKSLEL